MGMVTKSLEDRVTALEKENKTLKHELERTEAVHQILNLVHRVQWYHTANLDYKISTELMAKKAPDVRVYFGRWGYWEGPEEVVKSGKIYPPHNKGHMPIHLMNNPIIEVAGDGKTAKGVFFACGIVARKDTKTKKPVAWWEWNRYGIDFIKEDGQWKLYHHHIFDLFHAGWDVKWEDNFIKTTVEDYKVPDELKPPYPPTPLDVGYSPDDELPYIPEPKPYETFDSKTMY